MNISFNGYERCLKNFSEVKIISKYVPSVDKQEYVFQTQNFLPVGKFSMQIFDKVCFVSDLFLSENIRNRKTAADAIISMGNFIKDFAIKNKLSFVQFLSTNNPKIKRLYQKLGGIIIKEQDKKILYYAPVPKTEEQLQKEDKLITDGIREIAEKLGFILPLSKEMKVKHFPLECLSPFN